MTRTAFFGTPPAALPILEATAARSDLVLAITRPDRPQGRGRRPTPPAVKLAAERLGVPVRQPESLEETAEELATVDVAVLAAFGRIVPAAVFDAPAGGTINVHFSLLPRWRGAAPVPRSILAGDTESGVTIIRMDEGIDTGLVVARTRTPLAPFEAAGPLTARLSQLGGDLLAATLEDYVAGSLDAVAQVESEAVAAPKLDPSELHLETSVAADELMRRIRAFSPRPGAWGNVDGERIRVLAAIPADGELPAGRIELKRGRCLLGTGTHPLELIEVQPASRAAMSGVAWMNGRRREPAILT